MFLTEIVGLRNVSKVWLLANFIKKFRVSASWLHFLSDAESVVVDNCLENDACNNNNSDFDFDASCGESRALG